MLIVQYARAGWIDCRMLCRRIGCLHPDADTDADYCQEPFRCP